MTGFQHFAQFVIIGLGLGSAYALFAQGAVLIYRGSGIVNFAHGAVGMLAAYVAFVRCVRDWGIPVAVAVVIGVLAAMATGVAFQLLVLWHLRKASPVTRLIATLGLLTVLQSAVEFHIGGANFPVDPFLPHDTFRWGPLRVQEQVLYIVAITAAITVALWAGTRFSRLGLALRAASENERAAQTLGWSPPALAALTWAIGGGIAGVAGVLVAPLIGISPGGFTLVVTLGALAAALLGGFRSFPGTWLGGMVVGLGESMVTLYRPEIQRALHQESIPGLHRTVPFVLILIVLVARGRGLPARSHVLDRLPRLGSGAIRPRALLLGSLAATALLFGVFNESWAVATFVSLSSAVVVLSVVVLTGYTGQLSLGQWTLAGIGALLASTLVGRTGLPLTLAIPLGAILTVPFGLLFALPALRTRGVNLAIVTLGLGFSIGSIVFTNGTTIGAALGAGRRVERIEVFGIAVDSIRYPHRWAFVCLVVFVLAALMVANLRRSRTGLRLIAVRTNERAAASLGVSVFGVKLYAFGVASALAGLGGILVRFQYSILTYDSFDTFQSIRAVGYAVIGGVGYAIGPLLASVTTLGGFGTRILEDLLDIGRWERLIFGTLVLLVLVVDQNGIASIGKRLLQWANLGRAGASSSTDAAAGTPAAASNDDGATALVPPRLSAARPMALEVSGLTVRFGGVIAVRDVSFRVEPGEVVGLIGPNGAGKTTIIDAITGFVRPASGAILLGSQPIGSMSASTRARRGVRRSFQSLELFEDASVGDNLRSGVDSARRSTWLTDLVWPRRDGTAPMVDAAAAAFGLGDVLSRRPGDLPQGRRRLVALARALVSAPSIALLDEPAAGLDQRETAELSQVIRSLAHDGGMGVLLVEHDVGMVMATCDRVVVIDFGMVVAEGTPQEVRVDPAVRAAYLGAAEAFELPEPELPELSA